MHFGLVEHIRSLEKKGFLIHEEINTRKHVNSMLLSILPDRREGICTIFFYFTIEMVHIIMSLFPTKMLNSSFMIIISLPANPHVQLCGPYEADTKSKFVLF